MIPAPHGRTTRKSRHFHFAPPACRFDLVLLLASLLHTFCCGTGQTDEGQPMNRREVIRAVYQGQQPPYVPWQIGFTIPASEKLKAHYQTDDLDPILGNHCVGLGSGTGYFTKGENQRFRDIFGVVWDRSVDADIGVVEGCALPEPTLAGYQFPNPLRDQSFASIPEAIAKHPHRFRKFSIGFSLFERAWTLRGMENLMIDFIDNPDFVHQLLEAIADWNIAHVKRALEFDLDAIHFGDDWGAQHGLLMGPGLWREFIKPQLKRMYGIVRDAGKFVSIHSCGDVDELFDDLVEIGLNCFNPFQPEVMDVAELMKAYRGRLAFHGGLSTQQTLPYGTADDVRAETRRLLELGSPGGYIFAPAHGVPGDVPVENLVAMIETVTAQLRAG
jgi:uroporphyrinogen decarboxylase